MKPILPKPRPSERGQALAETAMYAGIALMLGLALAMLLPVHRVRTAATSAAYACAQFVSQAPDPDQARYQAELEAQRTLDARWSGTAGAEYRVVVSPAGGPGGAGQCTVYFTPPLLFNGLLDLSIDEGAVTFQSQSESWKARWD